jgi:hypothetical protein
VEIVKFLWDKLGWIIYAYVGFVILLIVILAICYAYLLLRKD